MDAIRISKVEGVACTKAGSTLNGTIHLTAHHLIFRYDQESEQEMWVPYPIISLVNRLPQTLLGKSPLTFHTRTFETFSLDFSKESEANDVFESVKELTVSTSVTQLYAFFYNPTPPFPTNDGWNIYSPRDEFIRMGVGSRTKAWRFTDLNKDYTFCPTYPSRFVVPTKISDTTLQYASKYRSKCRIPVLTYLHWANYGSITRSSQPMVGITQNRSIQDEKLIEAIFQSHHSPESRASNAPVYGATATNLIIDARPTANAVANTAKGAGTENMDHYKEGKKVYLGIDHIHAMRESLAKVVEALRDADSLLASINQDMPDQLTSLAVLDKPALRRSGWLRHISAILEGTVIITKNIHINSSHVLIHCSDGWDRTSQLSAMTQMCLDPYYRTIRGFQILIEKDWLSYGHKFLDRCGHLSSDKFFLSPNDSSGGNSGAEAFLASVQNRFVSQNHIKETSPVFHQFLETVRQVQRQFPDRFEFNERFLRQLYYHLYSCQFGTFLFNCERDRRIGAEGPPATERTISVWDYFNSPAEMQLNINPTYDSTLDDPTSRVVGADMGVLLPNPKDVRFWYELYGRTDDEMNGRVVTAQARGVDVNVVDAGDDDVIPRVGTPASVALPPSPRPAALVTPIVGTSRSASPAIDTSRDAGTGSQSPVNDLLSSSISSTSIHPLPPSSPTSSRPRSPFNRPRPKQTDFLSSSGVLSVWGKLSSNASAALSVVQDAYVGVAKDLRGGDGSPDRTAELRSRDTLSTWGESASSPKPFTVPSTNNPWAASDDDYPRSESLIANPWGSVRASSSKHAGSTTTEPFESLSPLPVDPTVAHPTAKPGNASFSATPRRPASSSAQIESPPSLASLRIQDNQLSSRAPPPPPKIPMTRPTKTSNDTDPLGVGLL